MRNTLLLLVSMTIIGLAPTQAVHAAEGDRIDAILAAQPEEVQARYKYRHPRQTLEFFGVEAGMTVVEALPGGGWYTKILLPYLGSDGMVIGADYSLDMWPYFGFANEKFLEDKKTWVQDWTAGAQEWRTEDSAEVSAFVLSALPESMHGTADAVLFIRALHNLARHSTERDFLGEAISNAYDVLKPGGVVGIVQHHARDDMPDDWADGNMGYLKKGFVIEKMQAAGFELVGESDMHANPKDKPTTEEFVWRLPPGYSGSRDNPELMAKMDAIGESNRMTLKFRKP
jgi:predicted methyltransferase